MNSQACMANCTAQSAGTLNSLFSTFVTTILTAQCAIGPPTLWPKDYGPQAVKQSSEQFDFVVIGSGAAGSVVAARLTENPQWRVLLIEAGGDPPSESELPPLYAATCLTPYDYNYTAYSSNACQSANGVCRISRGKMLGGTTSMNGLYYSRGNKNNYDEWAIKYGNPGWSYDDVLPYFKKSEGNLYQPFTMGDEAIYHNATGPMAVTFLMNITEQYQLFIDAVTQSGVPYNMDHNGASELGIGPIQFMASNDRRRASTIKAFINPIMNRPNLFVMKNGFATKILTNNNAATGVEIDYNQGTQYTAFAAKEVIVPAGVIGSPQLLMNSGIGPKDQLSKFNVKLVKDLPVGQSLQDHVNTFIFFTAENVTDPQPTDGLEAIFNLAAHNSGPYVQTLAIASFQNTTQGAQYPNYEAIYFVLGKGTGDLLALISLLGLNQATLQPVLDINAKTDILGVFFYLLQPESRGCMVLNSTSPFVQPAIYPNYFNKSIDLDNAVKAIKEQALLANTKAFQSKSAKLFQIPLKQCDQYKYQSDDYWKCYVKIISASGMHHVGTNRMGPKNNPKSVVDSTLKVLGIDKLRVIDSSMKRLYRIIEITPFFSMPNIVSGHITAPTVMIAEKGADFIKQQYKS